MKKKLFIILVLITTIVVVLNKEKTNPNLIQPYKTENLSETLFLSFDENDDIVISNEDKYNLYKKERVGYNNINPFVEKPFLFVHKEPFKSTNKKHIYSYKDITMYYNQSESKIGFKYKYKNKDFKYFNPKNLIKKSHFNIISSVSNNVYIFKIDGGYIKKKGNQACYQYYILGENINKDFEYCYKITKDKGKYFYLGSKNFAPTILKYKDGYVLYDVRYKHSVINEINGQVFLLSEEFNLTKSLSIKLPEYYHQKFDISNDGCQLLLNHYKYFQLFKLCN